MPDLNRRDFHRLALAAGALGLLDPATLATARLDGYRKRLSFRANRTAGAEGAWDLDEVEGRIPKGLEGTLYRTAPGQSEIHGVVLRHIFDGDAFVTGLSLRGGKARMHARFVATGQRKLELEKKKMLHREFGTAVPDARGRTSDKNQPSVNVIAWDGRLLGLSEGGHPTALDPTDLSYQSRWDFHGTLPADSTFTAHPKFCPKTGVGYAWGISYRRGPRLLVYRMELDGKLTQLHAAPIGGGCMIHDVALSASRLTFLIPSVRIDGEEMGRGSTVADALHYLDNVPVKLVSVSRDGEGDAVRIDLPPGNLYHHGNAFDTDDGLVVDSFMSDDNSLNDLLSSFTGEKLAGSMSSTLTRLEIDLDAETVRSRREIGEAEEFPRWDERRNGQDIRYLYAARARTPGDGLAFSHLVRHDLGTGKEETVAAGKGRAFGEPVFVPRSDDGKENEGWLLQLGFDGTNDRTFLEIRDAGTLELAARVWTPSHFPLGFHGNFTTEHFVT